METQGAIEIGKYAAVATVTRDIYQGVVQNVTDNGLGLSAVNYDKDGDLGDAWGTAFIPWSTIVSVWRPDDESTATEGEWEREHSYPTKSALGMWVETIRGLAVYNTRYSVKQVTAQLTDGTAVTGNVLEEYAHGIVMEVPANAEMFLPWTNVVSLKWSVSRGL